MADVKIEEFTAAKRAGGRPQSEGWNLYGFEKVDGTKGKCLARCRKCENTLKNTSLSRMANHHKRCSQTSQVLKLVPTKVDSIEDRGDKFETVVWETNQENVEQFINQSVVDNLQPAEMETIQEEEVCKDYRKSSSSKSHVIDAHLSSFLIGCNLTFDLVDSSYFKKFVNSLNSNYTIPSSSQLKARVISQLHVDSPRKASKKRRYDYGSSRSESD